MLVYFNLHTVYVLLPDILIVPNTDDVHKVAPAMVVNCETEMGVYYTINDNITQITDNIECTE